MPLLPIRTLALASASFLTVFSSSVRAFSASPGVGSGASAFEIISLARVQNAQGQPTSPLADLGDEEKKSLVVVLPQLGEFDSSEFCEQLVAASDALSDAGIALRVIGIGNGTAASEFCQFTGLDPNALFVDPDASIHRAL